LKFIVNPLTRFSNSPMSVLFPAINVLSGVVRGMLNLVNRDKRSWTLDEMIRHQAQNVRSDSAHVVADSLSVEGMSGVVVGPHYTQALRQFRKLRQSARLSKVIRTLEAQDREMRTLAAMPVKTTEVQDTHDILASQLRTMLRGGDHYENSDQVVHTIEKLVLALLSERTKDVVTESAVPTPKTTSETRSFPPRRRQWRRGQIKGSWASRSPMIEECLYGSVVVGSVALVRLSDDKDSGLYVAYFGSRGLEDPLPGQHTMAVAKRRVEDRFQEWLERCI
jgi:hypothetical protein